MRGLDGGELSIFVSLFIIDRFLRSRKPTYAYEIAWVLERDRGTIGNVLRNLEEEGEIVRVASIRKGITLVLPKPARVEAESKWTKAEPRKESDDWFKKYHDENCPCRKLLVSEGLSEQPFY